jgi:hypothetical protein
MSYVCRLRLQQLYLPTAALQFRLELLLSFLSKLHVQVGNLQLVIQIADFLFLLCLEGFLLLNGKKRARSTPEALAA